MSRMVLFGAAYSVYARIPRLVLEELGLAYELVEIDIFTKASVPADYAARHPFGRIPAFEHDGFRLFEADAIAGYILDCFGDHGLLPAAPKDRARMRQIMRIMDNYAYRALVWGIYVEEAERGRAGRLQTEELDRARTCLQVVEDLAGTNYLAGSHLTLADLWAYPMLAYLGLAPSGRALLAQTSNLRAWLGRMNERPSAAATRFPAELKTG